MLIIWAGWQHGQRGQRMNIENIKTALKEGIPFEITTAAGDKFRVEDEFQVALNPKRGVAILLREDGSPTLVSLLTITSLEYRPNRKPRSK
jgi:hypothetical protein